MTHTVVNGYSIYQYLSPIHFPFVFHVPGTWIIMGIGKGTYMGIDMEINVENKKDAARSCTSAASDLQLFCFFVDFFNNTPFKVFQ